MMLQTMDLPERFTCALVCKAWAEAATVATHSITLKCRVQDLSCLQLWLEKNGKQLKGLQLYQGDGSELKALPCVQLKELLLCAWSGLEVEHRVWSDIAAATNLTSISLGWVETMSQQADIVSALTALPNLQHLTWQYVEWCGQQTVSDSALLQHLTKLTVLELNGDIESGALQHLGTVTRLQHLSIGAAQDWGAAGCPGLQELKALTSLEVFSSGYDIPAIVCQLTALRQLDVSQATCTGLHQLQVLTSLTLLRVGLLTGPPPESASLQLPSLQHMELSECFAALHTSFLSGCTQLHVLLLQGVRFRGTGSLVASTMLQRLKLRNCSSDAADRVADMVFNPVAWQQTFRGRGRLPHLTSLQLSFLYPDFQRPDLECVVACCSSLQMLRLDHLNYSTASALERLSGLICLHLRCIDNQECGAVAQLTRLRELRVYSSASLSAVGLRQLAALEQLTSLGFTSCYFDRVDIILKEQMQDDLPGCSYAIINKVCSNTKFWRGKGHVIAGHCRSHVLNKSTVCGCMSTEAR